MAWNTGITGSHLNIAAYPGTPLRVMAGPGTGKTFALMRRVSRLLETGTSPDKILIVTFTRTAASDLISQLKSLGAPGAEEVLACTLHSLSFSLLRKNAVFQATNRTPRPLMNFEVECMIHDLQRKHGGIRVTKKLLKAFETSWATLQHQNPGWPQDQAQQSFRRDLMHWLIFHQSILLGELVPVALDFIVQNPASQDLPNYDHILVDEYQDLNRADQVLIDRLAINKNLTIVGDEDQSIYTGLRHARPEGITQFDVSHPNTHDEPLRDCKRCPSLPIEIANALILHNHPQRLTTLRPMVGCVIGEVIKVQHNSIQEEITSISAYIDWYLANHPDTRPRDILVLSTRRLIGYAIRDELVRLKHPAQSFFTEECLEKASARAGFCLLTLLVRSDDQTALRCWLGIGHKDWRSSAYQHLCEIALANAITPREVLERIVAGTIPIPPYSTDIVQKYKELLVALNPLIGITGNALIDILWPVADTDCADVRAIALTISTYKETPTEILDELVTAISQPELPEDNDDIIRVMSLHKSKGLTAKCVVVVGCVAGALPTIDSGLSITEKNDSYEEQRRLFYVAITRTKQTLVLSSAASALFRDAMQMGLIVAHHIGNNATLQASPFMNELGPQAPAMITSNRWRAHTGF